MRDRLIETIDEQRYEALKVPPDIELAKVHESAFKVGKHPVESVNRCLCCNTTRDYELIPLCCDIKELRYINNN